MGSQLGGGCGGDCITGGGVAMLGVAGGGDVKDE